MREVFRSGVCAMVAGAALLLASCHEKQTGPDSEAAPEVPDIATPLPPASSDPGIAKWNAGFEGADSDGDGRVSSAEYAASATRVFGSMDTDDDGALTRQELDAARTAMGIKGGPSSADLVERADNDGDQKLTLAEFIADVNDRFTQVDTNGNGYLTPQEYVTGHPEVQFEQTAKPASPAAPAKTK